MYRRTSRFKSSKQPTAHHRDPRRTAWAPREQRGPRVTGAGEVVPTASPAGQLVGSRGGVAWPAFACGRAVRCVA